MSFNDVLSLLQLAVGIAGTVAVITTLYLLRQDISLQRQEQHHQTETWQFELYQRIDDRVAELVWRQSGDERLAKVYVPLGADERDRMNAAQRAAHEWGAWRTLDGDEKVVYRHTRIFLETLEQMYEVRSRGWVSDEMWQKWAGWIEVWCRTRYFTFVFEDQYPRMLPGFRDLLRTTCDGIGVDCTLRSASLRAAEPVEAPVGVPEVARG